MTKNPPKITARSPPEPHDNGNTIQTKTTTPPRPTAEQKTYPNLLATRVSNSYPTEGKCEPTPPPPPPSHTSPNTNSNYNYSFSFCGSRVTVKTLLLIASLLLLYCTRYFWVQSTELANLRNAVQCAKSQPISATATVTRWRHGDVKQVTVTMRRTSTAGRTRMRTTTVTASPMSERPCHPEIRYTDAEGFVQFIMDARSKYRDTLTAATKTLEVTVTSTATATATV
jgi:hypothetical protein